MFLLNLLHYGYSNFIDLLTENDKEYTDRDVTLKMIMFGIILFLSIISTYYIPYIVLVSMSIGK